MGIVDKTGDALKKTGGAVKTGAGKVAGAVDITCDHCKKLMKPGILGEKRTVDGKDYQFCCEDCANAFEAAH